MIRFINKELFDLKNVTTDRDTFVRTNVSTAMKVVKMKKSDEMEQRIVTIIKSETEDYNGEHVAIHASKNKYGKTQISISSNSRNRYDSSLYLIAIPFNGFAEPIAKSNQYRIYKGMVVQSNKRNIEFAGDRYKKVLYLIVEPNFSLLKDDHKNHVDELSLVFTSYNLETRADNHVATVKSTNIIKFGPDYIVEDIEEVDPVNPEDFKGKELFPLWVPKDTEGVDPVNSNKGRRRPQNKTFNNDRDEKKDSGSDDKFEKMMDTYNKESKDTLNHLNRKNLRKGKKR